MKHFISIVAVLSLLVATAAVAAPADLDENAPTPSVLFPETPWTFAAE